MARMKKQRSQGRRSPLAAAALIAVGLLVTGGAYATASTLISNPVAADTSQVSIDDGKKLFQANCATCHGLDLQGTPNGPSLFGVGELATEFQLSTGRMPLQMQGPQAPMKTPQFTEPQILAIAAYVQSVAPGPTYPEAWVLDGEGDISHGTILFNTNCAMCHNVAGAGGALTQGKWAPPLTETSPLHMYAAMETGPQNMPVFGQMNLNDEDKRDIISALMYKQQAPPVGGFALGSLGPVAEGLFVWIFGIGALIGATIWITARSN